MTCIRCQQPLDLGSSGEPIRLVETTDGSIDVHARRRMCHDCITGPDAALPGAHEAWIRPARAEVHLGGRQVGTLLVTDTDFPWLAGWWEDGPAWALVEDRLHQVAALRDAGDRRGASRLAAELADEGLTVAFADGKRGDVLVLVRPDGTAEIDTAHRHPMPGGVTTDEIVTAV